MLLWLYVAAVVVEPIDVTDVASPASIEIVLTGARPDQLPASISAPEQSPLLFKYETA